MSQPLDDEGFVKRYDGQMVPLNQMFHVPNYADLKLRGFLCPNCGGRWFWTEWSPNPDLPAEDIIRCCKDQHGVGCKWKGALTAALDPSEDTTRHPLLRRFT